MLKYFRLRQRFNAPMARLLELERGVKRCLTVALKIGLMTP